MKTCTKCGVEKPEEEFRVEPRVAHGRTRQCRACLNAKGKAWRVANPVKCKQLSADNYRKNRLQIKARKRDDYNAHPEKHAAWSKQWQRDNRERVTELSRQWQQAHREECRRRVSAWIKAHPAYAAARNALRRFDKERATPAWTNHIAVGEFYALAAIKTRATGFPWHVDHIVPLRSPLVCGLHTHYNLQVLPGAANAAKGNRYWPDMPE